MDAVTISMTNTRDTPRFSRTIDTLTLSYPCTSNSNCSAYSIILPKGVYQIEAYGASGGSYTGIVSTMLNPDLKCSSQEVVQKYKGNTVCYTSTGNINHPGAGGYICGVIKLQTKTQVFANIGGMGEFTNSHVPKGGFNGGGDALMWDDFGSASGGGATDLRILKNDVYHRVIVGGGGGGSDNYDGYGGAGGYPNGQGFWIHTTYYPAPVAQQSFGFSFGQGESAGPKTEHPNSTSLGHSEDIGGAGGGWFGGFCSGFGAGGAGGGSSFILKKGSNIPSGIIRHHTGRFEIIEEKEYSFYNTDKYQFTNFSNASGIWGGNGLMRITLISALNEVNTCKTVIFHNYLFLTSMFFSDSFSLN